MSKLRAVRFDERFLVSPLFREGYSHMFLNQYESCEQISSQSAKPISAVEGELLPRTPRFEILEESVGNG